MIAKPRKNPHDITSYRPISLLLLLYKILEKILLQRLTPIIDETNLYRPINLDLGRNTEPSNKLTD